MQTPVTPAKPTRFTTYAWAMLIYLLGVILFGAWVRITGSGAGCGNHWPTCHGEVIPHSPSLETLIEYTHRLTSGLCGVLGLVLWGWAGRRFGWSSRVTLAALATLGLIIAEGAIGAGLVLKELVADDASEARAIVISLHLVNTLSLVAASSLAAWWSRPRPRGVFPELRPRLGAVMIGLVVVSMTGAITALGDTLFPVTLGDGGLVSHVLDDLSPTQHFLVRLRIVHPIIAIVVALGAWWTGYACVDRAGDELRPVARAAVWIVVIQVIVGMVSIGLGAPGWMQLIHLLLAEALWICFLLLFLSARAPRAEAH